MRRGEILGLQLSDFKKDGYIDIKRTRTKGVIGTGKTNNALRKIPYPSFIYDDIERIQPKDNIFLFGNMDVTREWDKLCKKANVTRKKLYCTGHTFATLMLKENIVSINELVGLLGHSSP